MVPSLLQLLILLCLATAEEGEWVYKSRYACAVCQDLVDAPADTCRQYNVCDRLNLTANCETYCGLPEPFAPDPSTFDLRVSKGFGTKAYDLLRVSVVTRANQQPPSSQEFDYSAAFKFRWTGNTLSTKMVSVPEGTSEMTVGGKSIRLQLPKQGDGVAGVLIADPCIRSGSITALVACTFAKKFDTKTRTPALLNALAADPSTDFWGILGDNFYDRHGDTTAWIYDQLTLDTKSKIMLTVPGNHDYWVLGSPFVKSSKDQYANGHMQWYAQDTKASEHLLPGDSGAPFNFSVDPSTHQIPAIQNSFSYSAIGNLGVVGYSGAYSLEETMPLMEEACAWLGDHFQRGKIKVGVLVGHWDTPDMGCDQEMAGPMFYDEMAQLKGCDVLDQKDQLKFIMGHTHCNIPHPHGRLGAGFMVAGQGMSGCGNYGVPIVDSTEGRIRMWYFEMVSTEGVDTYDTVMGCFKSQGGWRNCTQHATLWLDQELK